MTPLIISADDYAQSAAIDAAILALISQGRITATSCLTLSPRWPEAAKLISKEIRGSADIGLHLDFTQYAQDVRHSLPMLIARTISRSLSAKAIRNSINRQLDHFEEALGTAPDYVDGHQHVHQLPQIRDELLDIMTQRYASKLPWIRIARPPLEDSFKAVIIKVLGANKLASDARKAGLRCSDTLLGIYEFDGDISDYQHRLTTWFNLASAGNGISALMCHPALESYSAKPGINDPIYSARLREYQVFASDEFPALLAHNNVQPVRGDVLMLSAKN